MNLKTKFNIGQEVWLLLTLQEEVRGPFIVERIGLDVEQDLETSIYYEVDNHKAGGHWDYMEEDRFFATRQEANEALKAVMK